MGTYGFLVALTLRNIWVILFKQEEYKNLPIQMFYAFALIAVTIRLIFVILQWEEIPWVWNIDLVQQIAKLCVGVVQNWITLELAIRIHYSRGYSDDISETTKKQLRFASCVLFTIISLALAAFTVATIATAHKSGS